jgi:SAM-dependent methyltransferase
MVVRILGDNVVVPMDLERYAAENLLQPRAEHDEFAVERYRQFARHLPASARTVVDVGCSTGRGGAELVRLRPEMELWGVDVVQQRLDQLPGAYTKQILGLSTELPLEDLSVDVIVAGEFLEHLRASDVDPTLSEFQRVLRIGGRVILTTPNPGSLRLHLQRGSVYGPGHLTQHHARILRLRLLAQGFSRVRTLGTGKTSRYIGTHVPVRALYGSYLIRADKR